jgi:hypothetical protein
VGRFRQAGKNAGQNIRLGHFSQSHIILRVSGHLSTLA